MQGEKEVGDFYKSLEKLGKQNFDNSSIDRFVPTNGACGVRIIDVKG